MSNPRNTCASHDELKSLDGLLLTAWFMVLLWAPSVSVSADIDWDETIALIRSKFPDVTHISTTEAADLLGATEGDDVVLLDARELDEYEVGHLNGALLATDVEMAIQSLGERAQHDTIIVYCAVGYRSARLASKLERRGYENVLNLEGSLFKWANEGRPVYREKKLVDEVHPYDEDWRRLVDSRYRAVLD